MKVTTYLFFNGQAEEAANFYAEVLGGKIENMFRYASMPPAENGIPEIPEDFKQKVAHCCVMFGDNGISIADALPDDPRDFGNGGHMPTVHCDTIEQAETVFSKLSVNAKKINYPMGEVFYAKRYGELVDRFGILWAVMHDEQ